MINGCLKLVVLGAGRSGKVEVLTKYFKRKFNEGKSEVNPAFYEKTVNYHGKKVELKFWDTSGQKEFKAISMMYYQNSVGALLVYDASNFETFEKVKSLVITLHEAVGKDITIVIIGNKFDLISKNIMEEQMPIIESYCTKERFKHFYVSAKTGLNIDDAFDYLINETLNKVFSSTKKRGRKSEISLLENKKEKSINQEDIKKKEKHLQKKDFINLKLLKYYNV